MEPIKRRGFMTSLGAFFGLTPMIVSGDDLADTDLDAIVGDKPKESDTPRVMACKIGDVIELDFQGVRCQAILDNVSIEIIQHQMDVTTRKPGWAGTGGMKEAVIELRLRSVSPLTCEGY